MNYELAKQLKEAGFPLIDRVGYAYVSKDRIGYFIDGTIDSDWIYIPTLSELIEACGDKLFSLTRHGNIWQTNFVDGFAGETAGTLEEAVANLWLKINKG